MKDYKEKIISHMNEEHSNSIVSTLHAQHGIKDKNAKMVKLKEDGYFVLSNNKSHFLKFEKSCKSASDFKTELIKHAQKYRNFEL